MPEPSRESSLEDRKRDAARAGLNLFDERVAELMGRFDEVDATLAAINEDGPTRGTRTGLLPEMHVPVPSGPVERW